MPIVKHSASELRQVARVDWAKVGATTDADIERHVSEDSEAAPLMTSTQIREDVDSGKARVMVPADVDVRAVRQALGLSQEVFAARFGFALGTLRNWEQGRRQPDGPTRVLLTVIAKEPAAVARALSADGAMGGA